MLPQRTDISALRADPEASRAELDYRANAAKQCLLFDKGTPSNARSAGLRQRQTHRREEGGDEEAKGDAASRASGAHLCAHVAKLRFWSIK